MTEELVDRIRNIRFTPTGVSPQFRDAAPGYDIDEVDRFLEELVAAAQRGEPLGALAEGVKFTGTHSRSGYRQEEVDVFLATLTA